MQLTASAARFGREAAMPGQSSSRKSVMAAKRQHHADPEYPADDARRFQYGAGFMVGSVVVRSMMLVGRGYSCVQCLLRS